MRNFTARIDQLLNTLKFSIAVVVAMIISQIFTACKKYNDDANTDACSIITATNISENIVYHFFYKPDGKIYKAEAGAKVIKYEYSGNTTIITTIDSGRFINKIIATLNSLGFATNVRIQNDTAGASWNNTVYEYNGVEVTRSTYTSSGSGAAGIAMYHWSDGNLVSKSFASDTINYNYYTNQHTQEGDYIFFAQLLQGYKIYHTINLLSSYSSTTVSSTTFFTYEFASGKISSFIAANSDGSVRFDYEYQCDYY